MSPRQPGNASSLPSRRTSRAGARLKRRAPSPMALEQRFMFDGAAGADAARAVVDSSLHAQPPTDASTHATAATVKTEQPIAPPSTDPRNATPATVPGVQPIDAPPPAVVPGAHEIVFIDPTVANYQTLVADVRPGVAVVVLDAGLDPWQQMSDVIAQYQNLTAIHIVSHGASGEVLFGDHAFGAADLQAEAATLASWQAHLAPGADVLLYGCDIGAR